MRKALLTAVMALYILKSYGQADTIKFCRMDYYGGVQANQLFKQIFNLSGSTASISNPYLVTAAAYSQKNGWGLQGGFGLDYEDDNDLLTPANHESKIENIFYRGGIGRRMKLGRHFEIGYGVDYVGNYQLDKSFSNEVDDFGNGTDSTISVSTSKTTTTGFGAEFTLAFHITEKILLSTEATYYYMQSEIRSNVTTNEYVTNTFNTAANSTTISSANTKTVSKTFTFSLPEALFLVIKF